MKLHPLCLAALLASIALPACGGGGGGGGAGGGPSGSTDGELTVSITDAPFAYDIVTKAGVRVDRITLISADDGPGPLVLYEGKPIGVELLDLNNGVTEILVRTDVPAGRYDQIRLRVVGGHLELVDGDVFSTELGNLHLTSTGTSGIKVKIDPPLEVVGDLGHELLLDCDLTKSFHAVPGNSLLNATSYKLMPVIRAVDLSHAGEIRGVVSQDDGSGTLVAVDAATVYLMPPGEPDPANAVASTTTGADGAYALMGVEEGTWDVLAIKDPAQGRVDGVEVVAGHVVVADVEIQ